MMKAFDINDAREITGKLKEGRIVTREGKPVRIVCWDAKSIYPIVGLIEEEGQERVATWTADGQRDCHRGATRPTDLFIEVTGPKIETRDDALIALQRDYEEGASLREVLETAMKFADEHPEKGGER